MSHPLDLQVVDVDGAIRESAEDAGLDRSTFLRRGIVAGGGIVAGSALFAQYVEPAAAKISRRKSNANDVKILNFALTLEFLEAEFYRQADENEAYLDDRFRSFGRTVRLHEGKHVAFLRGALGSKAIKRPGFDFRDTVTDPQKFADTSQVLEDTGVTAYLGQVTHVKSGAVLAAAGTIATVEARHASWIRFLNGGGEPDAMRDDKPAPRTFDSRRSERFINNKVKATGFIKS